MDPVAGARPSVRRTRSRGVERQEYALLAIGGGAALGVAVATKWASADTYSGGEIVWVSGPPTDAIVMGCIGAVGLLLGLALVATGRRWKPVAITVALLLVPLGAAGLALSAYEHGNPERTVRLAEDRGEFDRVIVDGSEAGSWSLYLGIGGGGALIAAAILILTEERADRKRRRSVQTA